jgi:hypothetical protein
MPTGNTIPPCVGFHPTLILTEPERDLEALYFPLPAAQRPAPRPDCLYIGRTDRPEVSA